MHSLLELGRLPLNASCYLLMGLHKFSYGQCKNTPLCLNCCCSVVVDCFIIAVVVVVVDTVVVVTILIVVDAIVLQ